MGPFILLTSICAIPNNVNHSKYNMLLPIQFTYVRYALRPYSLNESDSHTIRIAHAHFVYTIRVDELKMKSPKRIRNNEVQTIIFILFIDTDCTEKEKRKKVKRDRERQLKRDGFSQKWRRQWVSWCMFSHWIFLPIRMCLNILYFLSLSLQASSPFVCSLWIILMKLQASRPFGFRKNFVFTVSTFDSGIFETFFGVTASDTNEK